MAKNTISKKTSTKPVHWSEKRSTPVDRTKRVASGCVVDEKNVLKSTRTRREVNYADLLTIRPGSRKVKGRKSANTQEQRIKKAIEYEAKKKAKK